MKVSIRKYLLIIIGLFHIGIFWLYFNKVFLLYANGDEGLLLDGAQRILHAQIPLRDFFYFHFPGDIYLLAIFFKLFRENYFAAKLLFFIFALLAGASMLMVVYQFSKDAILTGIASLFYFGTTLIWTTISHNNLGNFFVIIAIGVLLLSRKNNSNTWLFFAGVIGGFTCLIDEPRGISFLVLSFMYLWIRELKNKENLKPVLYNVIYFFIGTSSILLAALVYLILTNSLISYIATVKWVLKDYRAFNYYPFLYDRILFIKQHISASLLKNVFTYTTILSLVAVTILLPLAVSIYLIVWYIYKAFKQNISNRDEILLLLSFCYLILFFSAFYKPNSVNLWMLPFPALISLLLCVEWLLMEKRESKIITVIARSILMMSIIFLFYYSSKEAFMLLPLQECTVKVGINEMKSIDQSWCTDVYYLSKTISQHPENAVFIYHWSPILYFVFNKKNATSFDSYAPVYNTPGQLQQILKELILHKPLYIIKDTYIRDISDPYSGLYWWFPFLDRNLLKNDLVDAYIQKHYMIKQNLGDFLVYGKI